MVKWEAVECAHCGEAPEECPHCHDVQGATVEGASRYVTKAALKTAFAKLIADIGIRSASHARAEGREELAKLWEFFVVNAIGQIPNDSEAEGNDMIEEADRAVIEAANIFEIARTIGVTGHKYTGACERLERAVRARRSAMRGAGRA